MSEYLLHPCLANYFLRFAKSALRCDQRSVIARMDDTFSMKTSDYAALIGATRVDPVFSADFRYGFTI
jgi:hypothetical protein